MMKQGNHGRRFIALLMSGEYMMVRQAFNPERFCIL